MLFPFAPPDSIYDEQGRIIAGADELIADMVRGHGFVAYLQPWVQAVLSHGMTAQAEFLSRAGLVGEPLEAPDDARLESFGDDSESNEGDPGSAEAPIPTTFPEPLQAISVLSTLASRYNQSTVEQTAIELATQTLRYVVDSGQSEAFMTFLEDGLKPCPREKLERFGIP